MVIAYVEGKAEVGGTTKDRNLIYIDGERETDCEVNCFRFEA